jgi:hypothetical protein
MKYRVSLLNSKEHKVMHLTYLLVYNNNSITQSLHKTTSQKTVAGQPRQDTQERQKP